MSKYYRTTITNPDGTIKTARINSITGEVKPYPYKMKPIVRKVQAREDQTYTDPLWVKYIDEVNPPNLKDAKVTNVRKSKDNPNNVFLESYMMLSDAVEVLPILDNLVTGVSNISSGNNQTIPQGLLFSMLRDLDTINIDTIRDYTRYSDKYCYKLAQYLRILSVAFDNEIDK